MNHGKFEMLNKTEQRRVKAGTQPKLEDEHTPPANTKTDPVVIVTMVKDSSIT